MSNENTIKAPAKVTLEVCLTDAIFYAKYRGAVLQDETITGPNAEKVSVKGDLIVRRTILSGVISILQQRKKAIEADLVKMGEAHEKLERAALILFYPRKDRNGDI